MSLTNDATENGHTHATGSGCSRPWRRVRGYRLVPRFLAPLLGNRRPETLPLSFRRSEAPEESSGIAIPARSLASARDDKGGGVSFARGRLRRSVARNDGGRSEGETHSAWIIESCLREHGHGTRSAACMGMHALRGAGVSRACAFTRSGARSRPWRGHVGFGSENRSPGVGASAGAGRGARQSRTTHRVTRRRRVRGGSSSVVGAERSVAEGAMGVAFVRRGRGVWHDACQ